MGLGSAVLLSGGVSDVSAKTRLSTFASRKKASIVIVGGGTAGITVAARLRRSAPNADITLIAPNETHLYQSGQVFAAVGLYREYDNKRDTQSLLPDSVTWIKDRVDAFEPEKNRLRTQKHDYIGYDYLVVAMGCEYDFDAIEGIGREDIGKSGIASVYLNDVNAGTAQGPVISRLWMRSIGRSAQKRNLSVLFADPHTPIKGEGTSLSLLFLLHDMLKGEGTLFKGSKALSSRVQLTFTKAGESLLPPAKIDAVLKKRFQASPQLSAQYGHRLVRIDKEKKVATYLYNGAEVDVAYDFLHITPPMRAPEVIRNSVLSIQSGEYVGWLEVDAKTLRHPVYRNVFGIGDVVGLPSGKSGGAVREQAIVLQDNIAVIMEGKKEPLVYNGYSVAPVKTAFGRELLAEYTPDGLEPFLPLDPAKPRWLWWAFDLHLMRTAYYELMMRGMM